MVGNKVGLAVVGRGDGAKEGLCVKVASEGVTVGLVFFQSVHFTSTSVSSC